MSSQATFVTFNQAFKLVKYALIGGTSPMLHGSPSSGKTAVGNKLAKELNLEPIVFSLLDHEPSDVSGLPDLSGDKATFKPFDTFPIQGDSLPVGKKGWLILLDEFASGNRAMQAAANKLLYERMVGNKHLHTNAFVMAMGNLATDNAFVQEAPTHTKSRQVHFFVQQDVDEWVDWAFKAGIDLRVIAQVRIKPSMLTKFDPNTVDINYPCARTLEMLSNQLKNIPDLTREFLPLLQGTLGVGAGLEFYNTCRLADELPTIETILANPTTIEIPTKASYKYMLAAMISEYITVSNAAKLMPYIDRLPMDLQHFLFSAASSSKPQLITQVECIGDWADRVADKYL